MSRGFALFLLAVGILTAMVGAAGTILALGGVGRLGPGMVGVFLAIDFLAVVLVMMAVRLLRRTQPFGLTVSGGGSTARYPANTPTKHELDGTIYTVRYTPPVKGKNARPSVLTVSTVVDSDCEFQMSVETWFDKLCKRFGIATELQTGDEAFDEQCYVRTDSPAFTAAYLDDPLKRVAILDLRRFGFLEVTFQNGELSAKRLGFNPATDDRPEFLADVGARIVLLARNLPAHQPAFDERTGTHRRKWQWVLWLLLLGFAATVFSLIAFTPIATGELLLRAAPVLLAWAVFGYVSAYLLSGTSRSHNAWGSLMLGTLFLFPLGSAGIIGLLNGALDTSPATIHNALIVEKYTTRSKNKTKYHVRVASWREPGETISFQVGAVEYGVIAPNRSKLVVVTHAGALGVEWLESKTVDAKPKP